MDRQPVESSQIHSVGYDPESEILEVEFKRKGDAPGGVYQYFDVEPEQHQAFMEAESLGKHFGTSIRGKYRFAKVVPKIKSTCGNESSIAVFLACAQRVACGGSERRRRVTDKYILADDGKTPLPCDDVLVWDRWFESDKRIVARDETPNGRVSTVFLGLDHNFDPGGPPLLWETMVFGGSLDNEQWRYSTYEDAVKGHADVLRRVNEGEGL